jgi:D-tyrosyl-tRNA(Tyr) deacylase
MIALIQRVSSASVRVEQELLGAIDSGLLALIGVVQGDDASQADALLRRVLDFRVFADAAGRMNRSLRDVRGGLLLVPQFTLAAETERGNRPGFSRAAAPGVAAALYGHLLAEAQRQHAPVASGRFGASMQVSLVNDGPVTFWLQSGGSVKQA